LSDFAKTVEVFDGRGVSFVAVTQQFNTTTSMGRLTLNVLLSFAQFEREVTGERIRDKIAASKRKGMWIGGLVQLRYEVRDRQLVIEPTEAETVRHIFRRYSELGSVAESLRLLVHRVELDVSRVIRFAFLAPNIIEQIAGDRQPPDFTAESLLRGQARRLVGGGRSLIRAPLHVNSLMIRENTGNQAHSGRFSRFCCSETPRLC
jgi:Resolvase, N terminal domain